MGVKKKQDGLIEYIEKVSHKLASDNVQAGGAKYLILKHDPLPTTQHRAHRSKRSSLESRKKECKDLQISSASFEGAAGVASAASSAASSIPFFGSAGAIVSAGVAGAMYTAKAGTDIAYIEKDCDDVPFDEIKEILMERFNKLDQGIDRNFAALQELSKTAYKTLVTIEQTRIEMHQGFNKVLESIKQLKIEPVLSEMNIFMQYFDNEKHKINNLPKRKYIARVQETNNVLSYLKDSITGQGDTLYTFVYTIINRNFAYPEKANDISGFSALYALHYGTQTFFSVMFFLLEQHCYLADYYYQNRDLEMYNKHFDSVQATFDDFRNLLVGDKNNGLIDKVISTIAEVKEMSFIVDESDLLRSLTEKIEALIKMKREINEMILPVIDDVPEKLSKPKFKNPGTSTPIGEWRDDARVEYAMQYKHNGVYSKVGDWSRPLVVHGRANPILRISPDTHNRTRLIFRKFNDNSPQLAGIIEDRYQTEFWDIDRDLYNAASWLYEDLGEAVVDTLIQGGANVNAVFDQGRRAIHAAAEGGSTLIAMRFLNDTNINIRDDDGHTPLHLASKEGNDDFIQMLIEHGADVNAKTYTDQVTALHLAVRKRFISTVNTLFLSNKIEVNAGDKDNFTPLHNAVDAGLPVVTALLTNEEIYVNSKSTTGLTPLHLAAINNHVDIAEALSTNYKLDVNTEAEHSYTPFHFASIGGHLDIVKFFGRNNGTNLNARTDGNWTPLHFAVALKNDIIAEELLNEARINVNLKTDDGVTPLHIAAGTGQETVTLDLLKRGAHIEDKTKDGLTPLHIASLHKNKDIVASLVNSGAVIESRSNTGSTPLLLATEKGNFDIIKYLLGKNANLTAMDNDGNTVVHLSAKFGHFEIIKYFVDEKRFYINKNREGSPLYLAIQNGHLNIIEYLVDEKNLDANCKAYEYDCPLNEAAKFDSVDVVRYLVNKYPQINLDGIPLQNSARYGSINVLKYLIEEKRANINAKNGNGETPLHIAANYGWLNIVKYLIEEKNVDFNTTKDVYLSSPLHAAASSGNLDLVKYFIEVRHIDASIKDRNKRTPLHVAIIHGLRGISLNDKESSSIVEYLVDVSKVYVNAEDDQGNTPLHYAAKQRRIYPMKFLISRGANLDHDNKSGQTASEIATDSTIKQILDLQLLCNSIIDDSYFTRIFFRIYYELEINSKCVDPKQRIDDDIFESTVLNLAITYDESEGTPILLMKKGLNLNIGDQLGNTPLHLSVQKGKVKLINELIRNGADIDMKNNVKKTPQDIANENNDKDIIEILNKAKLDKNLRTATENGNLRLMKESIQQGAHLDTEDQHGNTLVHIASAKGYNDILHYLIENGCNINAFNKNGRNAIYLAISNGHFDIMEILLNNGAEINTTDYFYDAKTYWALSEENFGVPIKVIPNGTLDGVLGICLGGIQHDKLDTIKLLIDERNSLIKNTDGEQYEIYKLVKDGNINNLKELLKEQTINLNYLYKGLSPLADACLNGQLTAVKYLIENGSDINKIGTLRCTPLHWSVFGGHLAIVEYLIENANADRDAIDAGGRNILHYSVIYGRIEILKYLLGKKHFDINSKDSKNNTVVHFAAEWGWFDILKYLIDDEHAEISTKNDDGSLPLHKAAGSGYVEIAKYLAAKGAHLDDVDNNNKTPLFIASENGRLEMVKYLIDNGANITVQDKQGNTPVFTASKNGHFDIVEYFIREKGAVPSGLNDLLIEQIMLTLNGRKYAEDVVTAIAKGLGAALEEAFSQDDTKNLISNLITNTFRGKSRSVRSAASGDTIEINYTALCLENNFALGLLLLQNYFDKKYPLPNFVQVTPEEARASALELTEKFEEILKKSTKNNEVLLENIDFYQLYLDIETTIKTEKFSNVPKIIFEFSKKICRNDETTINAVTGMLHEMFTNFKNK